MELDINHLRSWIGATRESRDEISPRLAGSLAAVLDEPCVLAPGDAAPTGIQWCLCPDIAPMSELGPDGHPARGGFLPPVPLPRRMWAGGELRFSGDFRVGDEVVRRSRVADVAVKSGRSGALCFVTVMHDYATPRGHALSERHDIVYRALAPPLPPTAPPAAMPIPDENRVVAATPVLLMRYSAASFNGHRIHYDRAYCRDEELYPGLIVHGPLQASFLLCLACRMAGGHLPALFSFRGTAPLFDGPAFSVNGLREDDHARLWVADGDRRVTMEAQAR
ncbi:MAG: MaoC family dehydratase N-terminal domain-containing protein [Pseudolabrys sp.]